MKHRLAFFFIALLSCLSISAQKFELDPLWGDSIECMVASKPDSLWKISEPIQSVKFPKGMEIESCGKANGYYVAFKKDGASYMAYMGDLKFSADNPEDTVNPLSEDTVKKHSALGHFYATYTPAVLVLIDGYDSGHFLRGSQEFAGCSFGSEGYTGLHASHIHHRSGRLQGSWRRYVLVVRQRPLWVLWLFIPGNPIWRSSGFAVLYI